MRKIARWGRYRFRRALGRELTHPIELRMPTERHGTDYGGWNVASQKLDSTGIVLSFGVGGDISFDLSLIERYGVEVHAFDPTPEAAAFIASLGPPSRFHFHQWGVAARDGTAHFAAQFERPDKVRYSHNYSMAASARGAGETLTLPVFRYGTILDRLELTNRTISIVKMDIEGAEYEVLPDILAHPARPAQILVEFHHFLEIGTVADTRSALRQLSTAGYRTFDADSRCREFGLLAVD